MRKDEATENMQVLWFGRLKGETKRTSRVVTIVRLTRYKVIIRVGGQEKAVPYSSLKII